MGGVKTINKTSWGVWVKGEGQTGSHLVGGTLFDGIADFFGRSDLVLSCVKGAGKDVTVVCERDVGQDRELGLRLSIDQSDEEIFFFGVVEGFEYKLQAFGGFGDIVCEADDQGSGGYALSATERERDSALDVVA